MSEVVAMRCLYHTEIETVQQSCFRTAPESQGDVGVGVPMGCHGASTVPR